MSTGVMMSTGVSLESLALWLFHSVYHQQLHETMDNIKILLRRERFDPADFEAALKTEQRRAYERVTMHLETALTSAYAKYGSRPLAAEAAECCAMRYRPDIFAYFREGLSLGAQLRRARKKVMGRTRHALARSIALAHCCES